MSEFNFLFSHTGKDFQNNPMKIKQTQYEENITTPQCQNSEHIGNDCGGGSNVNGSLFIPKLDRCGTQDSLLILIGKKLMADQIESIQPQRADGSCRQTRSSIAMSRAALSLLSQQAQFFWANITWLEFLPGDARLCLDSPLR